MSAYPPRPLLRPDEQGSEIERIRNLARVGARLVRCDGSLRELAQYRAGEDEPGWDCPVMPRKGDLVLSTVKVRADRLVVSLSLVEGVAGDVWRWSDRNDLLITPPPRLEDVLREAGLSRRTFKAEDRPVRDDILEALKRLVMSPKTSSETESRKSLKRCSTWERSALNRAAKLHSSDGRCGCCSLDLRGAFGADGDRGLEVHHRRALAKEPSDSVETSLDDLAVLCATCHRLVHADDDLRIDVVRTRWALARQAAVGSAP